MQGIELKLPWPPSVNSLWRKFGNRVILSARARQYYTTLASLLVVARAKGDIPKQSIGEQVAVCMVLHPPENRRRDIDNYTKAVFDGLTKGRFWDDDKLVRREHKEWGEAVPGGVIIVRVERLEKT